MRRADLLTVTDLRLDQLINLRRRDLLPRALAPQGTGWGTYTPLQALGICVLLELGKLQSLAAAKRTVTDGLPLLKSALKQGALTRDEPWLFGFCSILMSVPDDPEEPSASNLQALCVPLRELAGEIARLKTRWSSSAASGVTVSIPHFGFVDVTDCYRRAAARAAAGRIPWPGPDAFMGEGAGK